MVDGHKGNLDLLSCGFVSGVLQAVIFNPWDRALYLSVKNLRPFLHSSNFEQPMKGVLQTLIQRSVSSGLYFPLEDIFRRDLTCLVGSDRAREWRTLLNFSAGIMAGMMNGVVMNPASSVKYQYWGKADCGSENFFSTACDMFQKGGFRPFFAGSSATISRDIAFGGTYALLRHKLHLHFLQSPESSYKSDTSQSEDKLISVIEQRRLDTIRFSINMISACVATIVSSPLNYIRNIHYATPPESPQLSVIHVLEELFMQTRQETGYYKQASFFLSRLRIGWGTARVGVGMAFGSEFYYYCSRMTSASASARD